MKKTIIVMPVANEQETMGSIIEQILALPYDNLFLYPVIDSLPFKYLIINPYR